MAQAKQLFGLCYHYHLVDVEHARGVGHSGLVWMCNYCGGAASVAVGKTWAMVGVAAIRVLINNVCLFVITFSLGCFFLFILFFVVQK